MKKNENNETENKSRTIEKSVADTMAARGDLLVAGDDTFGIALVYAYGTFGEFNELRWKLYGDTTKLSEADGYCANSIVRSNDQPGIFVWINSAIPKNQCFPTLIHEISHLADHILANARAEDRSGETRACIMEREVARVFPAMFGIKCHTALDVDKVKKLLK